MKFTINTLPALGSVIAFGIAYSISIGALQTIIPFQGAVNEFATLFVSFMLGAGLLISSFEKFNK
jgi:hypothetical protein